MNYFEASNGYFAMSNINCSLEKIAKKQQTLDDIAFQLKRIADLLETLAGGAHEEPGREGSTACAVSKFN